MNLTQKILLSHLVEGNPRASQEIGLRIDQTLMQDATGTVVAMLFEELGEKRVKTDLSVIYIDHNTLQTGFENPDDHTYLRDFAAKYGLYFSKPGNGICHQVHLERFAIPGKTLLGSDSHTPNAGAASMIAIGAGGLDVATAMAGYPYYTKYPLIVGVKLTGKLKKWVTPMDINLELLRRLKVKGGVGKIFEYFGPGVKTLSLTERATIANMSIELGATTSIFPSDEITREYFKLQGRLKAWRPFAADPDAKYDEIIEINLSKLEPMIAFPSSPDNVRRVSEVEGTGVDQVLIGSCTNSSYEQLTRVAILLKGRHAAKNVDFHLVPGSKQILDTLAEEGYLPHIIASGARIFEPACDGCVGIGNAPGTNWISLRSFNRNFPGRSGVKGDKLYLASPEVCVASAVFGKITHPKHLGKFPKIHFPEKFAVDDSGILPPSKEPASVKITKGPNIQPIPDMHPLRETLQGPVLIKLGDNISTDEIMPGGTLIMTFRSNVPAISRFTFFRIDPTFHKRAQEAKGGFIVAGENYGQGSSREHAAIAPMFLGVKGVLAKSFARIHRKNLINYGIVPMIFKNPSDYGRVKKDDSLILRNAKKAIREDKKEVTAKIGRHSVSLLLDFTKREKEILLSGSLLNYLRRDVKRVLPHIHRHGKGSASSVLEEYMKITGSVGAEECCTA